MTYYPHSEDEINQMLSLINMESLNEIKESVPKKFWIKSLKIDSPKTEYEVSEYFNEIFGQNFLYKSIFIGAGAYNHYIPACIDEITSRQEFYTAYTPYQAEISQGTLQAIFEYQSFITSLTGMDVSNASLYDGATALAESILMALRITNKKKVLLDKFIHPEYLEVVKTYLNPLKIEIDFYDSDAYKFDRDNFFTKWNPEYACFVIASPNFTGSIIDYSGISETIQKDKSILIHCLQEALSLAVLKKPADFNADIVCGEAQSFGMPLSFGGPYLGFMACSKKYMRKMPGRIAGLTKDKDGKTAYVLTLSTREQHIRREAATSNICSNHSLCAVRAGIYLSVLGAKGLKHCALKNIDNSHYLQKKISELEKFEIVNEQIFFNEFIVKTDIDYTKIKYVLEKNNILSFYPLNDIDEKFKNTYLLCSTEMNSKKEIDEFIEIIKKEIL